MMNKKNIWKSLVLVLILGLTVLLSTAAGQTKNNRSVRQKAQTAKVIIGEQGFAPVSIKLRRGIPARVTFLRTTDATCAKEIVLADYGIRRELPLNQAVVVSFTPKTKGEYTFACGMNMMRGKVIVQ